MLKMTINNNTSISERIRNLFKIQQAVESVPTKVAESILPVVDVSPKKCIQVKYATRGATGQSTLLTSNASRKTFITSIQLTGQHDATSDAVSIVCSGYPKDGTGQTNLVSISKLTTTARVFDIIKNFSPALEVEKGSVTSMAHTFTAGAGVISGIITFYEED